MKIKLVKNPIAIYITRDFKYHYFLRLASLVSKYSTIVLLLFSQRVMVSNRPPIAFSIDCSSQITSGILHNSDPRNYVNLYFDYFSPIATFCRYLYSMCNNLLKHSIPIPLSVEYSNTTQSN